MASQELQTLLQMFSARPVPATPPTLAEQRAGMSAFLGANPLPADVETSKVSANGVPAEWFSIPSSDPARVVLYLHGGGYVIGSNDSHREFTARVARACSGRVLSLDYRLAPEHPFPAAVDDAVAGYRYLLGSGVKPASIVIAGDSAGGGLTVATFVALKQAGEPMPAAGVCLSPWVDLEGTGDSMTSRDALDPMVHKPGLLEMAAHYLQGKNARDPLASPLYADLAGLPPMLIQVGTSETLFDDSTRLTAKAKAAGIDVTLEEWDEMIHVFQVFPVLPEARQATEKIGTFIRERTSTPVGAR
jgi:acetyl esterase/lipase